MNVIIDAGPLIAFLDKREHYHDFAMQQVKKLQAPFFTCESVLSETFFLLQRANVSQQSLLELLNTDKIKIAFSYARHVNRVHKIVENYANLPASFADACLVSMYEDTREAKIFTLDTDFTVYRTDGGDPLSLIHPDV